MSELYQHRARKRFGQNFLHDAGVIHRILRAIHARPGEHLVEIGPGQGALTEGLLGSGAKLDVIELDQDLLPLLRLRFGLNPNFTLNAGDALKFDFNGLLQGEEKLRVVGNLPYNISTPILFHLAEYADRVKDMTFMLQKEVVMRMVAEPGTEEYGRLSVMLQYRFRMGRMFDVPPGAFRPAPKVMSSIVRMAPLPKDQLGAQDETLLGKIVTAAFGQRRKTLKNTLRDYMGDADFAALGIDPSLRGEKLSVEQFVAIANHCSARG